MDCKSKCNATSPQLNCTITTTRSNERIENSASSNPVHRCVLETIMLLATLSVPHTHTNKATPCKKLQASV